MNLLIFATGDFYTKPNPSFHLLTTLITDMLNAGIHIYFVGIEEEGLNKHIPDEFENNPNFEYSLVKAKKIKKTSFVSRYLYGIKYAYDAKKLIKKYINNTDVVFARSSPTVLYNILAVRKVSKDVKIVYGIQDMFPGSTIASGKMPNKLMQKFFFRLQKMAYEKSTIITAISEDMKTKLLEQGVPEEKIRVIVNWFDDKSVREIPRKDNLFIKKYNMQRDQFYVQYAGTMGYVFDYNMVLSVARLLQEHDDIIFQMIGEGSQKTAFIEEAKRQQLSNIVFLPLEPQEMVPHVYSACDICFIPLKKGIIGNSVPSKAGLLMACKRAIVTTADEGSDYNRMINDEHIGIACSTDNPQDAADAIIKMKEDAVFRDYCANSGYEYGKISYSRSNNTRKYIELFEEIAQQN